MKNVKEFLKKLKIDFTPTNDLERKALKQAENILFKADRNTSKQIFHQEKFNKAKSRLVNFEDQLGTKYQLRGNFYHKNLVEFTDITNLSNATKQKVIDEFRKGKIDEQGLNALEGASRSLSGIWKEFKKQNSVGTNFKNVTTRFFNNIPALEDFIYDERLEYDERLTKKPADELTKEEVLKYTSERILLYGQKAGYETPKRASTVYKWFVNNLSEEAQEHLYNKWKYVYKKK